MKALLQNLREMATSQTWSQAVELSRSCTIVLSKENAEEIALELSAAKILVARQITLWPSDADATCDCNGPNDPCEHVIAAAIICNQPDRFAELKQKKAQPTVGTIRYQLVEQNRLLTLVRQIAVGEQIMPLKGTLTALSAGQVPGLPRVSCTKEDFTIETQLMRETFTTMPQWFLLKLFPILNQSERVFFESQAVRLSTEPQGLEIHIEDDGVGVRLRAKDSQAVERRFDNGVVLLGEMLCPYNGANLDEDDRRLFTKDNYFGLRELARLCSEILPDLSKRFRVHVKSKALPGTIEVEPRVVWETKLRGEFLEAYPVIVYGDPILARLENGVLQVQASEVPLRDSAAEQRLRERTQKMFGPDAFVPKLLAEMQAVDFMAKLGAQAVPVLGPGPTLFRGYKALELAMDLRFDLGADGLPFAFRVQENDGSYKLADPARVLGAWQRGEKMVPLLDGGWAGLPSNLKDLAPALLDILQAKEMAGKVPSSMLYDLKTLNQALDIEVGTQTAWGKKLAAIENLPSTSSLVQATLREYQEAGVHWLRKLQQAELGALLADDMGLGKTLQSICVLKPKTLIVAPSSVVFNWQNEILRFRPELKVTLYAGPKRSLSEGSDVYLCSYNVMRLDIELLCKQKWQIVILDEAQLIKNPTSQVAQAAYLLPAAFRLALSGTPVENRLDDIWSIFRFLNPGLLGTLSQFQENYIRGIDRGDSELALRLKRRLSPFIMRRLKSEVAKDLPPRTDIVRYCELDEREREAYQTYLLACQNEVVAQLGAEHSVLEMLEILLRLRQICCHLGLLPNQNAVSSSKLDLIMLELTNALAGGSKVLIFSQWTSFLDIIGEKLASESLAFLRIDGSTTNRQEIVERFQQDPEPKILLLSLKAAGVGLNLTAADHVFIVDPWWNPAVEEQAADRAHRIGQDKPVFVRRFVAKDTVEERILLLQEHKRQLKDSLVAGASGGASLTRDDLLSLFA